MSTLILSVTYGIGGHDDSVPNGNVAETVSATQADDGSWTVTTTDAIGAVTATRAGTADEAAGWNAQVAPPAPAVSYPTPEEVAALQAQLAAVQQQLADLQAQVNGTAPAAE